MGRKLNGTGEKSHGWIYIFIKFVGSVKQKIKERKTQWFAVSRSQLNWHFEQEKGVKQITAHQVGTVKRQEEMCISLPGIDRKRPKVLGREEEMLSTIEESNVSPVT